MRRIRSRTGPVALFGAMLAIALLLLLPLRLALGGFGVGGQGLTARTVSGSVWGGRLSEARFGDLVLGDLHASLSPLALLVGRARVALSGRGIDGAASISRHGFGVEGMTATLPTGGIFAPVPVSAIDLDSVSVRFRDGQCESAEGRVRATLSGDGGGVAVPQAMSGPARCEAGALLVPLTSQAGNEGVSLRIFGDGRYRAELTLAPGDAVAVQKLEALGFVATGSGYRRAVEGHF